MAGDVGLLLDEEPVGWAITRGTTGDESKFIPMTRTDLMMRISAGRAGMNYVATGGHFDLFEGVNLNLNFPSVVGTVQVGQRQVEYGYSSGIYTKHVSAFTAIRSLPSQEEIDALGGGKTVRDWEARFELAYHKCREANVTLVGGVCPTTIKFARYLHRSHRVYPRDLWQTQIMTLGSVPGINTRFRPALETKPHTNKLLNNEKKGRVRILLHSIAFGHLKPLVSDPISERPGAGALAAKLGIEKERVQRAADELFADGLDHAYALASPPSVSEKSRRLSVLIRSMMRSSSFLASVRSLCWVERC